jgi:regulatory protein YycI of two-component signal transduction system YycFG
MQTLVLILILFLISIFSVLLYFKNKNGRTCGAKPKVFTDNSTNTTFKQDVISSRILKNHGCSGAIDMEYSCKNCGMKEVHSTPNNSCGM